MLRIGFHPITRGALFKDSARRSAPLLFESWFVPSVWIPTVERPGSSRCSPHSVCPSVCLSTAVIPARKHEKYPALVVVSSSVPTVLLEAMLGAEGALVARCFRPSGWIHRCAHANTMGSGQTNKYFNGVFSLVLVLLPFICNVDFSAFDFLEMRAALEHVGKYTAWSGKRGSSAAAVRLSEGFQP